jgi:hypothetical protein
MFYSWLSGRHKHTRDAVGHPLATLRDLRRDVGCSGTVDRARFANRALLLGMDLSGRAVVEEFEATEA